MTNLAFSYTQTNTHTLPRMSLSANVCKISSELVLSRLQLSCPLPCPETCLDLGAMLADTGKMRGFFAWCEEVQCGAFGAEAGRGRGALQWQHEPSSWNKAQRPHLELRFKATLTSQGSPLNPMPQNH